MDNLQKLEKELYPFRTQDVNNLIEKKLGHIVTSSRMKLFTDCWTKLNSVWYIHRKIEELDGKYMNLGEALLKLKEDQIKQRPYIHPIKEYEYRYEAYCEAGEIEHLFFQAKACADIFARAIGSVFATSLPKNISKLIKILQVLRCSEKKQKAQKILKEIEKNKKFLRGVIMPPEQPNKNPKSLRDISTHYERLDVWFKIRLPGGRHESGVFGGFINTRGVLVQNFKAVNVSRDLWFGLKRMVENSYSILSEDEGHLNIPVFVNNQNVLNKKLPIQTSILNRF